MRRHRKHRRRTVGVLVEYSSDAGHNRDTATTLGAGGLFIETETPLAKGDRVKLRFQLPGQDDEHSIEGRVVWARRPVETGIHAPGMGIEFTDPAASARLARALDGM